MDVPTSNDRATAVVKEEYGALDQRWPGANTRQVSPSSQSPIM
jgi:hypothetical protein